MFEWNPKYEKHEEFFMKELQYHGTFFIASQMSQINRRKNKSYLTWAELRTHVPFIKRRNTFANFHCAQANNNNNENNINAFRVNRMKKLFISFTYANRDLHEIND